MPRYARVSLCFFVILSILLTGFAAFGQTSEPDRFYLGLEVGPIIPRYTSSILTGSITGSGSVKFNASGFVGLLAGYRFADHLGAEAQAGWTLYDSHDLVGTFSQSGAALPGDIPLNGDMHTWLGLVNLLYRPRREGARLSPYVGAGAGAAGLEWLIDSRPGGNIILSLRGGSLSAAVDVMGGADYALTKRFSLGGRYNFVRVISDIPTVQGGGIALTHNAPALHLLQMTGTYRF
jgi:opacity protein-like surface antigen